MININRIINESIKNDPENIRKFTDFAPYFESMLNMEKESIRTGIAIYKESANSEENELARLMDIYNSSDLSLNPEEDAKLLLLFEKYFGFNGPGSLIKRRNELRAGLRLSDAIIQKNISIEGGNVEHIRPDEIDKIKRYRLLTIKALLSPFDMSDDEENERGEAGDFLEDYVGDDPEINGLLEDFNQQYADMMS